MSLQHHHRGHHPGRNCRPSPPRVLIQVTEIIVGEQPGAEISQKPVDTRQSVPQKLHGVLEPGLRPRHTQRHAQQFRTPTPEVVDPAITSDAS
jgi:hypothetical protein